MKKKNNATSLLIEQGLPLALTVITFLILVGVVYALILLLNYSAVSDISTHIRWTDVLVGVTIYLKTSVDFAIFIGNLMSSYPGWKSRIAIEIGTAAGNALGTIIILTVWNFFRTVEWLLAIMIAIAALVLIRLAQDGLHHIEEGGANLPSVLRAFYMRFKSVLELLNRITSPVLRLILPEISMKPTASKSWAGLFVAAFSVPFILGLDDFAGYVPVFNIVNVFGFSVGVLLGHMVLNLLLFVSPKRTIRAVKHPLISLFGSVAFVLLAVWGFYEVFRIFAGH